VWPAMTTSNREYGAFYPSSSGIGRSASLGKHAAATAAAAAAAAGDNDFDAALGGKFRNQLPGAKQSGKLLGALSTSSHVYIPAALVARHKHHRRCPWHLVLGRHFLRTNSAGIPAAHNACARALTPCKRPLRERFRIGPLKPWRLPVLKADSCVRWVRRCQRSDAHVTWSVRARSIPGQAAQRLRPHGPQCTRPQHVCQRDDETAAGLVTVQHHAGVRLRIVRTLLPYIFIFHPMMRVVLLVHRDKPTAPGHPETWAGVCRAARGVNGDRRFPTVNGRPPTSSSAAAAAARGGGTPLVTFGAPREYATAAALRPASRSHARPPSSSQAATADTSGG
jgi:hypothetical protein